MRIFHLLPVLVASSLLPVGGFTATSFPDTELIGLEQKCLDLLGGGGAAETPIVLYRCHGGENQRWRVPPRGFPGPIIGSDGQCLEPLGGSTTSGTPLVAAPCDDSSAQRFRHRADGLIVDSGERCVDVLAADADADDGTPIVLHACHGDANQRWRERRRDRWLPAGLSDGARLRDFARAGDDGPLYAAGEGGVYVSFDDGASWSRAGRGIELGHYYDLDVGEPATLHAARFGGVFRSVDGGETWRRLVAPIFSQRSVFSDREAGGALYVGGNGLARSDDGGRSWTSLDVLTDPSAFYQVVDITRPPAGALFVALGKPPSDRFVSGVYRSHDHGETWQQVLDRELHSLESSPLDGSLWAGTTDGVWHSIDGGGSWSMMLDDAEGVRDVAIDPRDPRRLLAAASLQGAALSRDAGLSWQHFPQVRLPTAVGISRSGRLLAAGYFPWPGGPLPNPGVYFKDDDGGALWSQTDLGFTATPAVEVAVDPHDPSRLLASSIGLHLSIDGGTSWRRLIEDPPGGPGSYLSAVAFDPGRPGHIVVGCTCVDAIGGPTVLHSPDGGVTWNPLFEATEAFRIVEDIAIHGGESGVGYLITWSGNGVPMVYRSLGDLDNWVLSASLSGVSRLAVEPSTGVVYAGGRGGVWRSVDEGVEWSYLGPGGDGGLAVDPRRPGLVYAALNDVAQHGVVLRSVDAGETWFETTPIRGGRIGALAVGPGGELWAGTGRGIYRSTDGGESWLELGRGLPKGLNPVLDLAVDPAGEVFVATESDGLYRGLFSPQQPLALVDERFFVDVAWRDGEGRSGRGRALPISSQSGAFHFFDAANVEVLVKVLDRVSYNGHHWVFAASLSNLELDVVVTDDLTGAQTRLHNPLGSFLSFGDTTALPAAPSELDGLAYTDTVGTRPVELAAPEAAMLLGGRFEVTLAWRDFSGRSGEAVPVPLSDQTLGFFFFEPDNLEVAVKILDGRSYNGHFWVFAGALTNVAYRLEVRDLETGSLRVYENPLGRFHSFADTSAFD